MALTTNLVSYWKFEGNSNDSVGSNNGTDTSMTYGSSYGKLGQGANFNGSSGFIDLGTALRYERTQAWTLSFWMKSSTSTGYIPIYSTQEGSGNYRGITVWVSFAGDDKLWLEMTNLTTNALKCFGSSSINDGNLKHVVITYDGSSTVAGVKMYINGIAETVTSSVDALSATIVGTANVHFGRRPDPLYYTGDLDEAAIWTRVLTATEVLELFQNGSANQYPFSRGGFF